MIPPAQPLPNAEIAEIIGCLASGARIVLTDDGQGTPELRMPGPRLSDPMWSELCRGGWLEPMANGGVFKLSEKGLMAYLHSTDELGDGALVSPVERQSR